MKIIINFKTKYIELDNNQEIEIPKYPLLIGGKLSEEFYADIYRYLFIEKHKLNISRYPQQISEIKSKKSSTIYNNRKFALDCNGFPSEIGSDN